MSTNNLSKNVLWNTFGSLFYLGCQWLLSIAVVRLSSGYNEAGILSLAMSLSNIFATIALFNIRNYQVSDIEGKYSNSDYVTHRIVTCAAAILLCSVFSIANRYSLYVFASVLGFSCLRLVEAFADALHGIAQKKWRLDIAGKSYVLRGVLILISFVFVEWKTKNLAFAILSMVITNIMSLLLYDLRVVIKLEKFKLSFDKSKLLTLSLECLPLLIYGLFTNSIVTTARYFIEFIHGEEILGYYASVSSIAVLVQALFTFIFTPLIGLFTAHHASNDRTSMRKLMLKLAALLVSVTALSILAVYIAGDFVMSLLFGNEIRPYVYLLYPTVIASSLTAFMWLLGMLLIVIRDKVTLLIGGAASFITSIVLSLLLIPENAYLGANIAVISAFSLAVIIYLVRCLVYLFRKSVLNERNLNND